MKNQIVVLITAILCLITCANAQEPAASPTPPIEETIKVSTDEVHLNVLARSSSGKFVSTLTARDLLVVEDGTPQEIEKLERVPANVMLLLDTGRDLNFAKSLNATQLIAEIFVRSLPPNNYLSVMQYYDKVEPLADWNNNYEAALDAVLTKLFTGKRSRMTEALNVALENFKTRPLDNRHLVLVTDGSDTVADDAARQTALQNLRAANITVHIISYTQIEAQQSARAIRTIRPGDGKTKPRIDPFIYDELIKGMAMGGGEDGRDSMRLRARLKQMNEAQALVIVNLDRQRNKQVQAKQALWQEAESDLQTLADETGGLFQAAPEFSTTFLFAGELARAVDSQYVLTYTPKKPFENLADRQNRKVRVSTNCVGVEIHSRSGIIVTAK